MLGRASLLFSCLLGFAAEAIAVTIYKYTDANGVVGYTDRPRSGAQIFVFKDRMVERFDQQVRLETIRQGATETLTVHNDLYAPVEVELKLANRQNVLGAPDKPIRMVLEPRSQMRLAVLSPRDRSRPMVYTPSLHHTLGDPRTKPRGYRYPLPWRGGPFRLTQGANGQYSHFTPKGRYAMDIAMPEGTPIVAARAGTVIKIEDRQTGRGSNPSGNFVRVLHEDGTMSVYLHLQRGSVEVAEGENVLVGQSLAKSGNTGNSSGPHLHFVVQRNINGEVLSIPFEFAQTVNSLPNFAVGGE